MYQMIAKHQVRKAFSYINQGNFDKAIANFAPHIRFTFAGHHAIGADLNSRQSVRHWFDRLHEIFPDLKLTIDRISVSGLPWDMMVTTEFDVYATLPNRQAYHNRGVQVLRIRFGQAIEDHIIEDNLLVADALQVIREFGNPIADAMPIHD